MYRVIESCDSLNVHCTPPPPPYTRTDTHTCTHTHTRTHTPSSSLPSLVIMLMLTVGLVMFGHQGDLLGSPGWLLLGLASAMVLYFMHSYLAFFGGCILAIYTMSLWPHMVKRLTAFPVGKALSFAILTFIVLFLLSAWVVAYNFVPGGTVTRERTDVLLVITVLLIGLGSRKVGPSGGQSEAKSGGSKSKKGDKSERSSSLKTGRRLSTISEERSETDEAEESVHKARSREMFLVEGKEYHHFREKIVQGQLYYFERERE